MTRFVWPRLTLMALALVLPARFALAFDCIHVNAADPKSACIRWTGGAATLQSFLGTPSRTLINGTTTWDQNSVLAADDWNAQKAGFRFTVQSGGQFTSPCGAQGSGHACDNTGPAGYNPVFFANDICGRSFDDAIELTISCFRSDNGAIVNSSVFADAQVLWNAYDGPIRFDFPGGVQVPVYDIRRVLLHEFGHVFGLNHPDQAMPPQTVAAIMNSHVSNLDRLQDDDIKGLFSQYPGAGPAPQPTPTSGCQTGTTGQGAAIGLLIAVLVITSGRALARRAASQPKAAIRALPEAITREPIKR